MKKQLQIKALKNNDEAKRRVKSYFICFKRLFLKEKKKFSGKTMKQERLDKTIVEK